VLTSSAVAVRVVAQIEKTCTDEKFVILAYCVMPDHVHLVLEGACETSDLRRCAKLAKQRIESVLRTEFGIPGAVAGGLLRTRFTIR
jgi:REP element-mobilizing transposase RayT